MGIIESLKKNTMGIVTLAIVLVMGMILLTQLQGLSVVTDNACATGLTWNSTGSTCDNSSGYQFAPTGDGFVAISTGLAALGTIPGWFTLIVAIIVFVGIFGLFKYFDNKSK